MNEMTNSHILAQEFEYSEPTSVDEAVALLGKHGNHARVLAGGTDLIVQMKSERQAPDFVISILKIPGLDEITFRENGLHIGATVPVRAIHYEARVRAHYTALAEACDAFSTTQIQVMGTIGGNLCNASPAADCTPALIALGAEAVIRGPLGEKRLPLEQMFVGPGQTVLETNEMLVGVALPSPKPGTGSAFLKVARVAADIAKVNAAFMLVRDGDRVVDCRMVFGSVAPTAIRVARAEAALIGQTFNADLVSEAARIASEQVSPIDDVRSTAWYRREVVRVLTNDGLHKAWERAALEPATPGESVGLEAASSSDSAVASISVQHVSPTQRQPIEFTVNGEMVHTWVAPNDLLLNLLREDLALTGAKYGCGIGECGACTVQVDGKLVLSCLALTVSVNGRNVVTVEGLQKPNGELDALQQAFIEYTAFQCGYCTPGILMAAKNLLTENSHPTADEVREYLRGNLCRCTGYASIVRAIMGCADATRI